MTAALQPELADERLGEGGDVEASNATELPWNASDVEDQTCDGNLACAALGLSGFCCPQKDGYMFGCCPVLK